jgi:glycyl-tRNA synthetase
VYLRPETAQGMFVDFAIVVQSMRRRLPFGIAQQGKSFRNEISPSNSIFRTREFEQMEMEFFCKPGTDIEWHRYWCDERMRWWTQECGVRTSRLRLRAHEADELSHYSSATSDIEYLFPWGWGELEGVADRTDFDLRAHSTHSGRDLSYFDTETNERYIPYVIETAAGLDRACLTMLVDAWDEEEVRGEKRTVLRLHPDVSPWQVAVLPLSKKAPLTDVAHPLATRLRNRFRTEYDETQSIGRRYRRQDEIGTPLAVTVDFETLEDNAVTIRDRDGMTQVRVPLDRIEDACEEQLAVCRAAALERSRS